MQPEPKVNVLLVDDHPENLVALEAILEGLDQHLVKAQSGEEALRCLLNEDFAVILLDVRMPGMDGFETARLIRNRPRSQHTPIIFVTAYSKSETQMFKGYSLGAVDYLYKPVEPEILISKVTVFVDLFKKTSEIKRQAAQLAAINSELRESEERFRSLSACSPVGIFLTDVEGHCTYTNPRFQQICGLTLEESLAEGWLQSVHPEDRPQVVVDWSSWTQTNVGDQGLTDKGQEQPANVSSPPSSRITSSSVTHNPYSNEFRCQTSQGTVRQVHFRASPLFSAQGKLLGHVGTLEDITERKQAEEARAEIIREQAARKEAEAANRMKDEFLATLSHELRTPLHSVLGWARLLRTRSFDEATTARALETIERNAQLQTQLIEDILDISRIIRGQLHLHLHPLNIIPVIDAALDSIRPAAEAKSIQVLSLLDPSVGRVVADADRLQQIVWNLLSNAVKFTPEGGKIEIQSSSMGSCAQICVSDTGIGINPDFLPHVFDRFRQADSATTRCYGGLGLGLAIVRHLVELHHGSVYADSEGDGKGATFIVELPLHSSDQSEPTNRKRSELNGHCQPRPTEPCVETATTLSGLRVLIVDDEPDVRELLITVMEGSGAKAIAVASVVEAIQAIEQLQPDVLISDIGMPIEDGYTLISKIRSREAEQGGHLPAVALTAYARKEDRQQALESGFQMYMSKPVDTTELILAVANLARQDGEGFEGLMQKV
ncbi:MAG TPA: hybrid sensor histidine kinase/response regulator [Cyanobacteria bacterium UBA11162]|nr:hybrid sensor histidine kinase/response regulator [Cyanobacteria bacterium UBA11162]